MTETPPPSVVFSRLHWFVASLCSMKTTPLIDQPRPHTPYQREIESVGPSLLRTSLFRKTVNRGFFFFFFNSSTGILLKRHKRQYPRPWCTAWQFTKSPTLPKPTKRPSSEVYGQLEQVNFVVVFLRKERFKKNWSAKKPSVSPPSSPLLITQMRFFSSPMFARRGRRPARDLTLCPAQDLTLWPPQDLTVIARRVCIITELGRRWPVIHHQWPAPVWHRDGATTVTRNI